MADKKHTEDIAESKENDPGLKSKLQFKQSVSDKIAIFLTDTFGSPAFLFFAVAFFILWITWNLGLISGLKPFDKFPFQALEMVVSVFAIILSVSVLISQNRQGKREKVSQQIEFEVNVRAEREITKMLEMLHEIQKKLGITDRPDKELEEMKEDLNIHALHEKLDQKQDDEKF